MEAAARDIIRPTKIGRQVPVGAPSDTLHWRGVTGRNPAESPSPPFRGERVELQATVTQTFTSFFGQSLPLAEAFR